MLIMAGIYHAKNGRTNAVRTINTTINYKD